MTIQEVSRRSGLSEPTLRYYEEVGLVGPVDRDERSGHRRYGDGDLDVLQALACLRALGMGIEDMRTYQANRGRASRGEHRPTLPCLTSSATRPSGRNETCWTRPGRIR